MCAAVVAWASQQPRSCSELAEEAEAMTIREGRRQLSPDLKHQDDSGKRMVNQCSKRGSKDIPDLVRGYRTQQDHRRVEDRPVSARLWQSAAQSAEAAICSARVGSQMNRAKEPYMPGRPC